MNPVSVPVLSPTDMVVEVATLGLVCLGLWWWALGRLLNILEPRETENTASRLSRLESSLIALVISAPAAYYLFWLLATPPAVISATGVSRDAGLLDRAPASISWSDVTSIQCTFPLWRRFPRRFDLSLEAGSTKLWIGRMARGQAEKLLQELKKHVPAGVVHNCPAWTEVPFGSTDRF